MKYSLSPMYFPRAQAIFHCGGFSGLGVWSVYTEPDFHLILGFKLFSQTLVFTLNQDSTKGQIHRQWFYLKSDFTKKLSTLNIPLYPDSSHNTDILNYNASIFDPGDQYWQS